VATLLEEWGERFEPRYADGTRETQRDETFPKWLDEGAMRVRPGIKTTSSGPRWALTASFADLFDPQLAGDELDAAIDAWRDAHMSPGGRLKALTAQQREQRTHAVRVALPDGEIRSLEPGEASVILKGVISPLTPSPESRPPRPLRRGRSACRTIAGRAGDRSRQLVPILFWTGAIRTMLGRLREAVEVLDAATEIARVPQAWRGTSLPDRWQRRCGRCRHPQRLPQARRVSSCVDVARAVERGASHPTPR